ncbi:MAG TPA: hypothetical protein VGD30_11110 [Telluria sp.]
MDGNLTDFHLLTTIGAAFFALSFIRGMAGRQGASIWMAVLAALTGMAGAIDGGVLERPGLEPVVVILGYLILPLLAVLAGRRFYLAEQRNQSRQ